MWEFDTLIHLKFKQFSTSDKQNLDLLILHMNWKVSVKALLL